MPSRCLGGAALHSLDTRRAAEPLLVISLTNGCDFRSHRVPIPLFLSQSSTHSAPAARTSTALRLRQKSHWQSPAPGRSSDTLLLPPMASLCDRSIPSPSPADR